VTAKQVLSALTALARPDKADFLPGFFQAIPGGYGEGDRFLGCIVPDQRQVAKRFRELPVTELRKLLQSPWHECRLTGVIILVDQFQRASKPSNPRRRAQRDELVQFYLDNLQGVNNWDIVDSSAPKILGEWLLEMPQQRSMLQQLAASQNLWERRVAVLATFPLIRSGEFDELLRLAECLLHDEHELMHKAIGWMLRELGKRDSRVLRAFLSRHISSMPRTMLRYAIEKMPLAERQQWLAK